PGAGDGFGPFPFRGRERVTYRSSRASSAPRGACGAAGAGGACASACSCCVPCVLRGGAETSASALLRELLGQENLAEHGAHRLGLAVVERLHRGQARHEPL